MSVTDICTVFLAVSAFIVVAAIVLAILLRRAELKGSGTEPKRRILTPFQAFALGFFLAAVVGLYPVYHFDYLADNEGFVKILEGILLSAQNVLQMITLNGGFDNVRAFFASGLVENTLATVYTVYMSFILIGAPLLTAGFVLSLFKDTCALLIYSLKPGKHLYVFSELNPRSIALAKDIMEQKRWGKVVVFTNVSERSGEKEFELTLLAKRIGALCVKKDITELGLRGARLNSVRKLYFIGEDEDGNIRQALKLIGRCRSKKKYNSDRTQFYVFSNSVESEALLNSADNDLMKVRRIYENRSLALQELTAHPIFDTAIDTGKTKKMNIVILGLGGYGEELLKAISWCAQMPGYSLEIHAFDKENGEDKVKLRAPEFIKKINCKDENEAHYSIKFHNDTDVKSTKFLDKVAALKGVTGIYVALGDDELNIETAINVRTALCHVAATGAKLPPIYAIVYSASKTNTVANGLKDIEGNDYGITFIGALRERYSLKSIEQPDLEATALDIHLFWSKTEEDKRKAEKAFNHYEYYRRSSMAQAIYRKLRGDLGFHKMDDTTEEGRRNNHMLRNYEHRRWNAYIRAEGYIRGDCKDHIAKTHTLLKPFDELPESEQMKDDF